MNFRSCVPSESSRNSEDGVLVESESDVQLNAEENDVVVANVLLPVVQLNAEESEVVASVPNNGKNLTCTCTFMNYFGRRKVFLGI